MPTEMVVVPMARLRRLQPFALAIFQAKPSSERFWPSPCAMELPTTAKTGWSRASGPEIAAEAGTSSPWKARPSLCGMEISTSTSRSGEFTAIGTQWTTESYCVETSQKTSPCGSRTRSEVSRSSGPIMPANSPSR